MKSVLSFKSIVLTLLLSTICSGLQIFVDSINGSDALCQSHQNVPCKSLEKAKTLVTSSSLIVLKSDVILHQVLVFDSLQNVSIKGYGVHFLFNITCKGQYGGIYVKNGQGFSISRVKFIQCGRMPSTICKNGAVIFSNTSEVSLWNVSITNGNYSGLMLLNNRGLVNITDVKFIGNQYAKRHYHNRNISEVNSIEEEMSRHKCRRNVIGGGINIIFSGKSQNSTTYIMRCYFHNNSAHWGGGLHIIQTGRVANHTIFINSTVFEHNQAWMAGGGMRLNIICRTKNAFTNRVFFYNTSFIANNAKFGSGVTLISAYNENKYKDPTIIFHNCSWINNTATATSPAVDIAAYAVLNSERYGFLPIPSFTDIDVINNFVAAKARLIKSVTINDGVFLITQMKVIFSGHVCFASNSPTALKAVSGGAVVDNNARITFFNNTGINGAAIALYGFSYIYLSDNITITFKNNVAKKTGAAIYYHCIDQHDFFVGSYCFLENKNKKPNNVTIILDGNKAENGSWLFAESFLSCAFRCNSRVTYNPLQPQDFMKCIANFVYDNNTDIRDVVSTSGRRFRFLNHDKTSYSAIPGREIKIPYVVVDDFNSTLKPLAYVSAVNQSSGIVFDRKYTLESTIYPIGKPNQSTTVDVTVNGVRTLHFRFQLKTRQCPPGFVYSNNSESCECGNDRDKNRDYYQPIQQCTKNSSQAILDKEYWVGYIPEESQNYKDLYFAPCFHPICLPSSVYLDNDTANPTLKICGKNRHGIMCGKCKKNTSLYYHSKSYTCGSNRFCRYGPVFYILSELLPVLIVFLVVLAFDLSLTSGNVVGLIFFSQYLEGITITTNTTLDYFKLPYQMFYGIFNLEYFTIERLSFCVWKGLNIQNLFMLKYLTVIFAFTLVVVQIFSLKKNRFFFIFKVKRYFGSQKSFIHGLSAFLVMCYIQCTKTSLFILKAVQPTGLNRKPNHHYTYYGGQKYFTGTHKLYASFAVLIFATVTVLPAFILLLHPLLLQVLSLCNLGEHRLVLKAFKFLRIQKLIPFLDCFQSCYKDKCRMFAGLYFLYKVALLLVYVMAQSYKSLLVALQVLLIIFLAIHATIQPYKKKLHNVIDSIIFSNLLLVNLLSIIDNIYEPDVSNEENNFRFSLEVVQIVLVYLPMVACLLYIVWKTVTYCKIRRNYYNYDVIDEDQDSCREYKECQLSASAVILND